MKMGSGWSYGALSALLALFAGAAGAQGAATPAMQATGAVGTCTPELVYELLAGSFDARAAGTANVASIRHTDADGNPLPNTSATIDWSVRAIVEPPRPNGAQPILGGNLDFLITTASGERLKFTATCVAGSGAYDLAWIRGITLYANGLTEGWPGGNSVRRTFVHFETWTFGADTTTYLALIDGVDCNLDFSRLLVTLAPYGKGQATFSGTPDGGDYYSETNCANRFGNPFPRSGPRTFIPG